MLKAVLFDVDGTLSETERHGHLVAMNRAFRAAGLDWQWSEKIYGELLRTAGSIERIHHYIAACHPGYRHVNKDLDDLLSGIVRYKNTDYRRMVASGEIPLRPGVKRVLREIQGSDVRMGIVTTTARQNVDALLLQNIGGDVLDWFEVIAAGNVVAHKKPAPDIYIHALQQMELSPAEVLAVEDSENGVRSALATGMPVLAIKSEYSNDHDLSGAALLVDGWGAREMPMNVLHGDACGHSMISLELMRRLVG